MTYTKADLEKFEDYEDLRIEMFTLDEIKELDAAAKIEIEAIKSLQESITAAVAAYMAKEQIGFNELTRRLEKGHANLSMGTIAHLSALLGKKPKIVFE
jgi:hypothetical protein